MLIIVHPAIGAILAAKAILHRVHSILEECGYYLFDPGQIVGMHTLAPEGGIFQIFGWRVAEHVDNIVADEGRRKIAGGLEAVDHRR